jgi:hypothetical protein
MFDTNQLLVLNICAAFGLGFVLGCGLGYIIGRLDKLCHLLGAPQAQVQTRPANEQATLATAAEIKNPARKAAKISIDDTTYVSRISTADITAMHDSGSSGGLGKTTETVDNSMVESISKLSQLKGR